MSLNAPPDFPTVQFINERLCVSSQISDWSINVQIIVRGHVCVFHFVPLHVHPHIIEAVWCFLDHLFELFDPRSVLLLYIKCFEPPAVFGSLVLCLCTCWTACSACRVAQRCETRRWAIRGGSLEGWVAARGPECLNAAEDKLRSCFSVL